MDAVWSGLGLSLVWGFAQIAAKRPVGLLCTLKLGVLFPSPVPLGTCLDL